MTRRVWIIGPVAIDTVAYIDHLPSPGEFIRPHRTLERMGGSSGNVAIALSKTGIETGFIGYIGGDESGIKIENYYKESRITHLYLKNIEGPSNRALVMIDRSGNRTIVALTESYLSELSLKEVPIEPNDIVVFSLWRPIFADELARAQELGCTTVVGLEALADSLVRADFAIGSEAELGAVSPEQVLNRFPTIVVTRGANGVHQYAHNQNLFQEALADSIIDTTGAGDSFLAGYLAILARGEKFPGEALLFGSRWAACTVAIEGSEPSEPPL